MTPRNENAECDSQNDAATRALIWTAQSIKDREVDNIRSTRGYIANTRRRESRDEEEEEEECCLYVALFFRSPNEWQAKRDRSEGNEMKREGGILGNQRTRVRVNGKRKYSIEDW